MEFLILLAVGIVAIYWSKKKAKAEDEDEARERTFRATMLALEEKAKAEGTFVVSYFDGEKK